MLSHFIRRGAKRKGGKGDNSHQKSCSLSSSVVSPVVLNINDDSLHTTAQTPLLVKLNLSGSHEDWFPPELLRSRSCSPEFSLPCSQNARVSRKSSREVPRADPPVASPPKPSEELPPRAARKKAIPAPILIPRRVPNIQIGQSAVTTPPPVPGSSQPYVHGLPLFPPPSPSTSDDLSAISGTTLARALIASSFVLSSERRSSRHRSVARQDSATLPRRESVPRSSFVIASPVPPVPPLPSTSDYTSPIMSGTSAETEYPMSDAYITSPELALSSDITQGFSRTGETSSGTASASTTLSVASDTVLEEKTGAAQTRPRLIKDADFDVPKTAVEVPPPDNTQGIIRQSSEDDSLVLSDDHSLDEFDFVSPEPLVVIASPGSDSSASFASPVRHRSDPKRKRRVGGSDFVRNDSKDHVDPAIAPQPHSMPSATVSDYGELLHYDLTLSPGTSSSSNMESGESAGYQTFPETPMVFSPLFSPAYALLSRSDTQVLCTRPLIPKSPRVGLGQKKPGSRAAVRQADNEDDKGGVSHKASSSLSGQDVPLQLTTNPTPPVQTSNDDVKDETDTKQTMEPETPVNPRVTLRPHPLARLSTSSSCVPEEEALRALAGHSPATWPTFVLDDDDVPTSASANRPLESPVAVAFPQSTDESALHSLALDDLQTVVSSSATSCSLVVPTVTADSQPKLAKTPLVAVTSFGESFLPSPPPLGPSEGPLASSLSSGPVSSSAISDVSVSPSYFPPPPYHTVVSERTAYHPDNVSPPALSSTFSSDTDASYRRSRQASSSSIASGSVRGRGRSRPVAPLGPRKPTGPSQVLGAFDPQGRKGSAYSVGDNDHGFPWAKLQAAASTPPPKFQMPPPKWRGLTLEAAKWTFTSEQLQEVVSRAIQQSSEGSSIRLLRLEVLEGEVADEMHRLELQHTDVKAQYKALWRKRWTLMGTLAHQIEGAETGDASQTMETLAEVLVALDHLTDRMHDIVLQMSQLKSLRDVHNASALALAVRKINGVFVRQMVEKERLQTHMDTVTTERDEAWKHAEDIARDYDALNNRVSEAAASGDGNGDASTATISDSASPSAPAAAASVTASKSIRISAVRHSCSRLSRSGLRSRSRHRHASDAARTRPTSLALDDPIPPVPRMTINSPESHSVSTGMSLTSTWSCYSDTTEALALAAAQRDVYDMLGLSVPPSSTDASRRRTLSSPVYSTWAPSTHAHAHPKTGLRARPKSEVVHVRTHVHTRGQARGRTGRNVERGRATQSVVLGRRGSL